MGYRIYPEELNDSPTQKKPIVAFIISVALVLAIFYYGIDYLQTHYAIAQEISPCSTNYNRITCLDHIERKLLQSIARNNMDGYNVSDRAALLQALATMHCPPIKIQDPTTVQAEKP
jgi:hypothetical protein